MPQAAPPEDCRPLIVVFTDLDGTLLDHETYGFDAALPALESLRRSGTPLVFCTSKTAAETLVLRETLGNTDPFITENGGGVFIPEGYFPFDVAHDRREHGCLVIDLGAPYARLTLALKHLAAKTGLNLKGFAAMRPEEVAALCGFSLEEAGRARLRDYDEPFIVAGAPDAGAGCLPALEQAAAAEGLAVTGGGRFFHLIGQSDKGRAVTLLLEFFRKKHIDIYSIALGDSANDLPMLRAADRAVLIRKKDGSCAGFPPDLRFAASEQPGPAGWNAAVSRLLDERLHRGPATP